jgi:hypothetical protein
VTATPADVAFLTNPGVRLVSPDQEAADAIKAVHIDAKDMSGSEIEMFCVDPDHAQALLDEKAAVLTLLDPVHEGIEVEESLGVGNAIPISPKVPSFLVIDESRGIDQVCRLRAFASDMHRDRYSVEVLQ